MRTVRKLLIAALILIVAGCGNSGTGDFITVKVLEVQHAGNYTYLYVKGKGPKHWIAVPTVTANPGETYSYQGGLMMTDFYSRELDRTFDEVLFVESLNPGQEQAAAESEEFSHHGRISVEKAEVNVESSAGAIKIAELYADPESYKGKKVRVTGEVSKFNAEIMDRNWVHIQDGSEHEGQFDLTATSSEYFEQGSVVTLEGTLAVDKDFGYGYRYEILLEDAVIVK